MAALMLGICAGLAAETASRTNALPGLRKLMDTPLRDTSICRGPDGTWYLTGTVEPFWAFNEALPHAGHNMFFQDEKSRWWSSYFGSDGEAPWQERPGVLPVTFDAEGRIRPANP